MIARCNIVRIYPYDVAPNVDHWGRDAGRAAWFKSEVVAKRIRDEIKRVENTGAEKSSKHVSLTLLTLRNRCSNASTNVQQELHY